MIRSLKCGGLSAKINSLGAELVSLSGENGFEYLWTGDEKYWTSHAPVLFPIVGALRGKKAKIAGRWYEMGQHGFARHMEFIEESSSESSVSFRLDSNFETKKSYPFEFSLLVTYTLSEHGIKTDFAVKNKGDKIMPFVIGGHPGFNIPVNEAANFEDYVIEFEKSETQACPSVDIGQSLINPNEVSFRLENEKIIPLTHELFYGDALIFENLNSSTVAIKNPRSGRGIKMEFTGFPMLGIWSAANDGPYVALEPWTGCATLTNESDEFEEKKNMILLPANAATGFSFTSEIL